MIILRCDRCRRESPDPLDPCMAILPNGWLELFGLHICSCCTDAYKSFLQKIDVLPLST